MRKKIKHLAFELHIWIGLTDKFTLENTSVASLQH